MSRLFLTSFLVLPLFGSLPAAERALQFNRDIRPILSQKCIACHGPDGKHREADLRLDIPEGAFAPLVEGEGYAIVPGKPEESQLLARIDSPDPDEVMPPPHFHKEITAEERAKLEQWILQGAEYQPHWSYTPLVRPAVPELEKHPEIARNAIDHFVLKRLEEENLAPSPLASEKELRRRLALDLTGLPPSEEAPADLEAFLEQLLSSPAYGERMAVPWLDIARFSDTVGYHGDQNQRIFPYRDYVIDSFAHNKPYDQFIIEQLAGDLLPNPTEEQLVATGFNRLNLMSREGGAQPKEYLKKYAADRVRAVGTALLGQTTGCAECHDHKFDPITAKDFYSLAAFFDDVQQWGVYQNYNNSSPALAGFINPHPFPPELVTQSSSLLEKIAHLQSLAIEHLAPRPLPADGSPRLEELRSFAARHPEGWAPLTPIQVSAQKETPTRILAEDQSVLMTGSARKDEEFIIDLQTSEKLLSSLRLEALPHAENAGRVGRAGDGRFQLSPTVELLLPDGTTQALPIRFAQADLDRPEKYSNGDRAALSFGATWLSAPAKFEQPADLTTRPATAVLALEKPLALPEGARLRLRVKSPDIGRLRFAISPRLDPVPGQPAFDDSFRSALASGERANAAYHLCFTPPAALDDHYRQLLDDIRNARGGWARTLVTHRVEEARFPTRVLNRGDWQDDSGEIVAPATLSFLPADSVPKDRPLTRLDLAHWIVADENPLTARHFVNRLWKQFFGTGLSAVLDDLGGQGEPPSHPELLDWLAVEFRESGWNVQHLVRLIVDSHTYRQKAAHRDDLLEIDPYNRLLAQQAGRRLDAEFIRDQALAVSGLLDRSLVGGPSIFPYQPDGYYEALNFPTRGYPTSRPRYEQHRRSVYTHWQRTFLHPTMANFDAPARDECAADRPMANSPQQALTLLNDPIYVEAARALRDGMLATLPEAGDEERVAYLFDRVLQRQPDEAEQASFARILQTARQRAAENENPAPAGEWFQAARLILNLHETITRY
ncbi:PSD1 and planctomycete cytochrome C domain-containing protein [Roseibacillus ishigakijimensis]|uniref:PSD1 domain-containing protein n=1 Tax=Roseibacillus ishigakijimensis TaxID=454146 RepID=A0A934VL03_9BACT|nr:PSD1 and planctomycete cytochrome C domain-containing protein [Roseibacillus ishigakijimensis]MBK1834184.1 PSD1 domain-containing protein [Roseibacillus ishigakijimensis]